MVQVHLELVRPIASMRPRVFPAEDPDPRLNLCVAPTCFNEAAGIPRGRLHIGPVQDRRHAVRFNEAAGIPRGRLRPRRASVPACPRFNEAAGIPRGRLTNRLSFRQVSRASMRPRVFPAEDGRRRSGSPAAPAASMRPRVFPAEDGPDVAVAVGGRHASMRPRVFPAEDVSSVPSAVARTTLQ